MATGRAVDFTPLLHASRSRFAGRRWLIERMESFAQASDGPSALLVVGDPGAGKTAVLARFVDQSDAPHFFCGRSDGVSAEQGGGWSEPVRCAETLGTQLARAYGDDIMDWSRFGIDSEVRARHVAFDIDARINRVEGRLTVAEISTFDALPRPPNNPVARLRADFGVVEGAVVTGLSIHELRVDPMLAFQEFFLGPLRCAAGRTTSNIVVVLDALDEWDRLACPVDVLELMHRSALPRNVRVVASARPSYLPRLPKNCLIVDISDVASQAVLDDDIAELVDRSLAERSLALLSTSRADFIHRAGGNFLFATYLLEVLDPTDLRESLARLPSGLNAFYQQELARLADRLALEGLRGDLGPLLAVICSAREPLSVSIAACASGVPLDSVTDLLGRMSAFIRPVHIAGEERFAPFHLSFSDFVLSGHAGLGISPTTGHRRLVHALRPASNESWLSASDYAIRHLVSHAASMGEEAFTLTRSIIETPAYLVARVSRIGAEALESDLRRARQAGFEPPYLAELVAELALRNDLLQAGNVSMAQGMAVIAGAVGASGLAAAFSALARDPEVVVPSWSAGHEGARIAIGGFRSPGKIKDAALTKERFLTLAKSDSLEIWDLQERRRFFLVSADSTLQHAITEPDARHVWAAFSCDGGGSQLRRLSVPAGDVVCELFLEQDVNCMCADPGGRWIAAGTRAGRVFLLKSSDGSIVGRRDTGSSIECLRIDGDQLAALTRQRKVVAWAIPMFSVEGVALVPSPNGGNRFMDRTEGLAFDASQCVAVVGGVDGFVTWLNLKEEGELRQLAGLSGWADQITFINGDEVLVGDSNGRLHFIDRHGARAPNSFRAHAGQIVLVGRYAEPGVIVSVANNGEISLWRTPRNDLARKAGHAAAVADVAFGTSPDQLTSLGSDGSIVEWEGNGAIYQRAFLNPEHAGILRLSADRTAIVIEGDGALRHRRLGAASENVLSAVPWPIRIRDKCNTLLSGTTIPISITDDATLATRAGAEGAEIWSFDPDCVRLRFAGERPAGRGALSGDGQLLITEGEGRLWLRWLATGAPRTAIPTGDALLCAPFWTENGISLLVRQQSDIQLLRAESLQCSASWTMEGDKPNFALASPDGECIAVFGVEGLVELRHSAGQRLGAFVLRPPAAAAAFSSNGRSLAVGDASGGVHVFSFCG